jgi:hypothetical protein
LRQKTTPWQVLGGDLFYLEGKVQLSIFVPDTSPEEKKINSSTYFSKYRKISKMDHLPFSPQKIYDMAEPDRISGLNKSSSPFSRGNRLFVVEAGDVVHFPDLIVGNLAPSPYRPFYFRMNMAFFIKKATYFFKLENGEVIAKTNSTPEERADAVGIEVEVEQIIYKVQQLDAIEDHMMEHGANLPDVELNSICTPDQIAIGQNGFGFSDSYNHAGGSALIALGMDTAATDCAKGPLKFFTNHPGSFVSLMEEGVFDKFNFYLSEIRNESYLANSYEVPFEPERVYFSMSFTEDEFSAGLFSVKVTADGRYVLKRRRLRYLRFKVTQENSIEKQLLL